ncbi:MAG TPA: ABC transporter permease [Candidatus Binatia bacterium]|nr:ABC transporter permease [Candidatus Binatia bacterium]
MILRWTLRNVFADRGSLLAATGGIAVSLLLVLVLDGMFAGEAERIVSFLRDSGADVWVMQPGVANVHMASSLVRAELAKEVATVPGVASVTPILYVSAFVKAGGREWFSYVVGRRRDDELAAPRRLVAGVASALPGEAILPDVVAAESGVGIGDRISFLGRDFRVSGITAGTYSMANSVTFASYEDLADLLASPDGASYLLVRAAAGVSPERLAERIDGAVKDVDALPIAELVDRDRRLALQMGVDVIRVMTWIGALVAAVVVAFTVYSAVASRARELAVAKSLGAPGRSLLGAVVVHALLLLALGYAAACAIAIALRAVVERALPQIAIRYTTSTLAIVAVAATALALCAALVPARRVARVDPALVFRG